MVKRVDVVGKAKVKVSHIIEKIGENVAFGNLPL
jgi:hypothetical protein